MSDEQSSVTTAVATARPDMDDRAGWRAYWASSGAAWRIEPEIDAERQAYLAERRAVTPNVALGVYPFAAISLTRADLEWLLAAHEDGRGPVDGEDASQRTRAGLDLRGADLRRVSLRGLPLARCRLGLAGGTEEQIAAAVAHCEGADLRGAHLEGADLRHVHFEGANLQRAWLGEADLSGARLDGANGQEARLEAANLHRAHLTGANLRAAALAGADLREVQGQRAILREAGLEAARLGKADLREADLSDAHAEAATLREAHLERARLSAMHLEGANLYRAYLQEANLEAATLAGCNLEAARLEGANLYGAHLEGRRMEAEDLARVRRGQRDESLPETLPPADLRGACCDHLTNLRHMTPGDRAGGFIRVADVTWGGANLSVVNWNTDRPVGAVTLGDEREARRARLPDGARKDRAQRLKEYEAAVRANRQLAVALQAQGMNEEAAAFAYRALALRRQVLRRQGPRKRGAYLFSLLLDSLAGYGYRPLRTLLLYVGLVVGFGALYFGYGISVAPHLRWYEALVVSLTAFHGRVFAEGFRPGDPQGIAAAIEAVCGLVIEASFIATFTQRFFGGGK